MWQVWQTKLRAARDVVDWVIIVTVCVFKARLDRRRWDAWQVPTCRASTLKRLEARS